MNASIRRSKRVSGLVIAMGSIFVAIAVLVAVLAINNRPPNIVIPSPTMPKINAYNDFERAGEMVRQTHHYGPLSDLDPKHVWTLQDYECFMKDNAGALSVLKKGLNKPYLHPPVRGVTFPIYSGQRELARTTASAGMYYELIGKPGKAADSYLDGMEFGVMFPRGGSLLTGLVGVAIENINAVRLGPVLPKLATEDLERVAKRLETIEKKRTTFEEVIVQEGYSSTSMYLAFEQNPNYLKNTWYPRNWVKENPWLGPIDVLEELKFSFANKSTFLHAHLDYFNALAAEQRGPYRGRSKVMVPRYRLTRQAAYVMARAHISFASNEATSALLRTEVALRRYSAANGRYPDSLSELTPTDLKSEPIDPFGGRPLKYKSVKNGQDFLLYSIGPTMKDDGGAPGRRKESYKTGDIVVGKY